MRQMSVDVYTGMCAILTTMAGRPKKTDDEKCVPVGYRLPPATVKRLKLMADRLSVSQSVVIARALALLDVGTLGE